MLNPILKGFSLIFENLNKLFLLKNILIEFSLKYFNYYINIYINRDFTNIKKIIFINN